jgi:hypothetical protein
MGGDEELMPTKSQDPDKPIMAELYEWIKQHPCGVDARELADKFRDMRAERTILRWHIQVENMLVKFEAHGFLLFEHYDGKRLLIGAFECEEWGMPDVYYDTGWPRQLKSRVRFKSKWRRPLGVNPYFRPKAKEAG